MVEVDLVKRPVLNFTILMGERNYDLSDLITGDEDPKALIEIEALADDLPPQMSRMLTIFVNHFGELLPNKDIYGLEPAVSFEGDWEANLHTAIARIRKELPSTVSIYSLHASKKYILDWNFAKGTIRIPSNRIQAIQHIPEEIYPLATYCNAFQIQDSIKARGILSPPQLKIIKTLVSKYPYPVSREELAQMVWRDIDKEIFRREVSLEKHISHIRKAFATFNDGSFGLYNIHSFKQYLLAPKLEVGSWIFPYPETYSDKEEIDEIKSLIDFFRQVRVRDSINLDPRLSKTLLSLIEHLGSSYRRFVSKHELEDVLLQHSDNTDYDFHKVISQLCRKVKEYNDESFHLYFLEKYGQYLLSPRLCEFEWFLPANRKESVRDISEEFYDFVVYCNEIQAVNDKRLRARMTPNDLVIINHLISEYPKLVSKFELITLMGFDNIDDYTSKKLRDRIGSVRRKITDFNNGAFVILSPNRGYYSLYKREDVER